MITWVYLCGLFSILFGIFHLFFWRLFKWKSDLKKLTPPNRAIMQILNIRLIYVFFFVGFLCLAFPHELISTPLGNALLIGCSLFWLGRTIEQFVFLKMDHVLVHILTVLFLIGTILFLIPVLGK